MAMTHLVITAVVVGAIMFALGAVWGSRPNWDLESQNARLRSQLEMLGEESERER
jgi:hypothetical protein